MPAAKRVGPVVPGEQLSVIEEFDGGEGTRVFDGVVRSALAGEVLYDFQERQVKIKPARVVKTIPKLEDVVIGQVESVQSNVVTIRIYYVNGERSDSSFTGMLSLKPTDEGVRRQRRVVCKLGDLLRARIVSDMNAVFHLSVDRREDGVILTTCSQCGGAVKQMDSKIKCVDCGAVEERKLASDFGKVMLS